MNLENLIEPIVDIAVDAGKAILEVYATEFDVQEKSDESPLTQADLASHRRIVAGLAALTPDIPIISEEDGLPAPPLQAFEQAGRDCLARLDLDRERVGPLLDDQVDLVPCLIAPEVEQGLEAVVVKRS